MEDAIATRKARKRAIREWTTEYQRKHGGASPGLQDREGVRHLFVAFTEADRAVREIKEEMERGAIDGRGSLTGISIEELRGQKKEVKTKIREFLLEFQRRYGRSATATDKEAIRPLYMEYKSLSDRISAMEEGLNSPSEGNVAAANKDMELATASLSADRRDSISEKIASLRLRFQAMKESMGNLNDELLSPLGSPTSAPTVSPKSPQQAAKARWSLISRALSPNRESSVVQPERQKQKSPRNLSDSSFEDMEWIDKQQYAIDVESMFMDSRSESESVPKAAAELQDVLVGLRDAAASAQIPSFGAELEASIRNTKEEIIVSRIPVDEMRRRMLAIEKERMHQLQVEADEYCRREESIATKEEEARARLIVDEEEARKRIADERLWEARQQTIRQWTISQSFSRARFLLEAALASQKATLREKFGHLVTGQRISNRRYSLKWRGVPQPIEMRVHMLRDVKEKLPKGRYVLLLSMADCLGGRPMRWSKARKGCAFSGFPATTKSVFHSGRYFDFELRFDQSVFQLCPGKHAVAPSSVFILELFQLVDARNPMDRVVAWGVLPMCDKYQCIVSGKFKIPLLRGEVDPSVRLYRHLHARLADDLGSWLANIYVDVRLLPRDILSPELESTYHIECDHIRKQLQIPNEMGMLAPKGGSGLIHPRRRSNSNSSSHFSINPPSAKVSPANDLEMTLVSRPTTLGNDEQAKEVWWRRATHIFSSSPIDASCGGENRRESNLDRTIFEQPDGDLEGGIFWDVAYLHGSAEMTRPNISRVENGILVDDGARWDSEDGLKIPHALEGSVISKNILVSSWCSPLRNNEDAKAYYYTAVEQDTGVNAGHASLIRLKVAHVRREILSYAPQEWNDLDWWLGFCVITLALWSRMYIHFLGQWMYLQALRVPLHGIEITLYEVSLQYSYTSITTRQELGVVLMGPLFVILCFLLLLGAGRGLQRVLGTLTDPISKLMIGFGVGAALDPLLIFFVDLAAGNFNCASACSIHREELSACNCHIGDAWKLPTRMEAIENNGVTGAILTAFIYFETFTLAAVLVYWYLLNMHLDGRMLDVWTRITAGENDCFLPRDDEISLGELQSICTAASRWVGPDGSTREIRESTEEGIPRRICIFETRPTSTAASDPQNLQEQRERIHRQFILLEDGAILELFV